MPSKILIDTNILVALSDTGDKYHAKALEFARNNKDIRVVPDVVLVEVTHLLNKHIGHHAVIAFLEVFKQSKFQFEVITVEDVDAAHRIMKKYVDAKFDFVDCCIMALAERLNITRVATFDRRDFSQYIPPHCPYLELLP
jgi:uncharacterized protein